MNYFTINNAHNQVCLQKADNNHASIYVSLLNDIK